MKVFLLALVVLMVSAVGLGISLIIGRKGFYSRTSIEKNPDMKRLGITCVKHEEMKCYSTDKDCGSCACH